MYNYFYYRFYVLDMTGISNFKRFAGALNVTGRTRELQIRRNKSEISIFISCIIDYFPTEIGQEDR